MVTAHSLEVAALTPLTADSFLLSFAVPAELREVFDYKAGQYVTIETEPTPGERERRSYSICIPPHQAWQPDGTGQITVGVKVLPGGRFSTWARDHLGPGDRLTVLSPAGRFTVRGTEGPTFGALAAGSGITPIMAIAGEVLHTDPTSRFVIHLINRTPEHVMFATQLDDWQRTHPDRFEVVHHWTRTSPTAQFGARISDPELIKILRHRTSGGISEWFLCGPQPLVVRAQAALAELGIGRRLVHTELFHTS